jgi:outer membrane protein TolC
MRRFFFVVLGSIVVIGQAQSQQPPARIVTLEQAVTIAVERNKDLNTALLDIDKADARVNEAWGYAMPSVDLSANYTRSLERPVFFLPDFANPGSNKTVPVKIGTEHSWGMTLSARQTIFNSTVIIGVGAAHVYSEVARELYQAKKLETISSVRKAYYGVLLASEARNLMRANLKNAEENLQNVRTMSKQGLVSEYDELRATVGVENLRPEVIRVENGYALAVDALKSTMGLDASEEIVVDGTLQFQQVPEDRVVTALDQVKETNAGLKALRLQVDVNQAFLNVERSNYLPMVSAFGNLQYQAAKNTFNISTNDFFRSSQVGLSLSFSLFQGFQTNARVDQAKVEVRKTEEQVANLENILRTAAHSLVLQLKQSQQRIEAQGKTVEQAERGYRIATTRFLSGAGTQLEVNDAQLALTQAKVNRIQAVYDYLVASADFDRTLGYMPDFIQ